MKRSCQALFSLVFFFSVERKSGFLACGLVHHISLYSIYDLVDRVTFFSGFSDGAEVNNAGNWWEKFFDAANFISSFSFLHLEKTISELSCVYTLLLLGV